MERWFPIEGYEGRYEVSDLGHVRSLDRAWVDTKGRHGNRRGRVLKSPPNSDGYPLVKLYDGTGNHETLKVGSLVLAAFVGPRPDGMEVCHNDGVPSNSSLTNLRYDTPIGNQADRVAHGTHLRGERHPRTHLSDADVIQIRSMEGTASQATIAAAYGIAACSVNNILKGRIWRHLL
jgi:hypothetical protein